VQAKTAPAPAPAPAPAKRERRPVAAKAKNRPAPNRSGSETRKKAIMVTSRYDEAEFAELDEAASRAGMTRASYQRVQSLAEPKTRSTRRAPVEKELLAKVLGQIGKIGSNLNQVAHAANLDRTERAKITATVADLQSMLPLLLEALGRKA
jgi:hypothetical protein